VLFNVQIGMHDGESGDISLLGLKLSVFIPNAVASSACTPEICEIPDVGTCICCVPSQQPPEMECYPCYTIKC